MFPVQIFGRQGAMVVASPFLQNYDPTPEGACEFSQWPLCAIFSKNIGAPVGLFGSKMRSVKLGLSCGYPWFEPRSLEWLEVGGCLLFGPADRWLLSCCPPESRWNH